MSSVRQINNLQYSENGYGQFIDLESQKPIQLLSNNKSETVIDIYDKEYNEYLDNCEHMLEYGPPANLYMDRNEIVQINNYTPFTNPVFYVITYLIQWIRQ